MQSLKHLAVALRVAIASAAFSCLATAEGDSPLHERALDLANRAKVAVTCAAAHLDAGDAFTRMATLNTTPSSFSARVGARDDAIRASSHVAVFCNDTEREVIRQAAVDEVTKSQVLVLAAAQEIGLGQVTGYASFQLLSWPKNAVSGDYILRSDRQNAITELKGSVARAPMLRGEPVTAQKLAKPTRPDPP